MGNPYAAQIPQQVMQQQKYQHKQFNFLVTATKVKSQLTAVNTQLNIIS